MKIYNTMTRKKEEFIPLHEGEVSMYACGPTVYNYIHIGNARPLIMFDTFRRYLEYRGYKVLFAQNFTDVDDKIINRAAVEGGTAAEIAEKYIRKGKQLYIEGKIRTSSYGEGEAKKYRTEIIADQMTMLGSKGEGSGSQLSAGPAAMETPLPAATSAPTDDLPF